MLLVARRDYLATVRTKAFLIGLVVAPLLFGGSILGLALFKDRADLKDRRIAVVDATDRKSTHLNSSHAEIYTLSLHHALPIWPGGGPAPVWRLDSRPGPVQGQAGYQGPAHRRGGRHGRGCRRRDPGGPGKERQGDVRQEDGQSGDSAVCLRSGEGGCRKRERAEACFIGPRAPTGTFRIPRNRF